MLLYAFMRLYQTSAQPSVINARVHDAMAMDAM